MMNARAPYVTFPDMWPLDTEPGSPPPNPKNITAGGVIAGLIFDTGTFRINFPYDPKMVEDVKHIPGVKYNPDGKNWVLRKRQQTPEALQELRRFSERNHFGWARIAEKRFNEILNAELIESVIGRRIVKTQDKRASRWLTRPNTMDISGIDTLNKHRPAKAAKGLKPTKAKTQGEQRVNLRLHKIRKTGSSPAPASKNHTEGEMVEIEHAYRDWQENKAYLDGQGNYRLKVEDSPIAPWNKAIKRKYGRDNASFHNDSGRFKEHPSNLSILERAEDERPRVNRNRDENLSNKNTISHTDARVLRWKRNPGSMDIKGIDTPRKMRGRIVKLSYPSRKKGKIIHTRIGGGTVLSRYPVGRHVR